MNKNIVKEIKIVDKPKIKYSACRYCDIQLKKTGKKVCDKCYYD